MLADVSDDLVLVLVCAIEELQRGIDDAFAEECAAANVRLVTLGGDADQRCVAKIRDGFRIVEFEQELAVTQRTNQTITDGDASDVETRRIGANHGIWLVDWRKRYPDDAVTEIRSQVERDLGGQPHLADTAWIGEGQEAGGAAKPGRAALENA